MTGILWIVPLVLLAIAIGSQYGQGNFKFHSFAILGGALYLYVFAFMPWVTLSPDSLLDMAGGDVAPLLEEIGIDPDSFEMILGDDIESLLDEDTWWGYYLTHPTGAMLTVYYPNISLFLQVVLWVPILYAGTIMIFGLLSIFGIFTGVQKFFSGLLSLIGIFAILPLLIIGLPLIDSWGTSGEFVPSLVALVLDARLGGGAWWALGAVLLLIAAGERLYAGADDRERDFGAPANDNLIVRGVVQINGKVWSILGAVLLLLTFFFLPWIEYDADDYEDNLAQLNQITEEVRDPLCEIQGLEPDCELYQPPWPFIEDDVRSVQRSLDREDTFTGLAIAMRPLTTNVLLNVSLFALMGLAIVNLLWSVFYLTQYNNEDDMPMNKLLVALGTPLVFVFSLSLLSYYPDIEVFATVRNLPIGLVMAAAGAKVGYGAVVGLLAALLMVLGGFRELIGIINNQTIRVVLLGMLLGIVVGIVLIVIGFSMRSSIDTDAFVTPEPPPPTSTPTLTPTPEFTATPVFTATPEYTPTPVVVKPDYIFVMVPVMWSGTQQEFETEARRLIQYFLSESNFEKYFEVEIVILEEGLTGVSLASDDLYYDLLEYGTISYPGDRYIGLTDGDLSLNGNSSVAGYTFGDGERAVLSESGDLVIVTHELGHTYGLCDEYNYVAWSRENEWADEGCPNQYPDDCPKTQNNGVICDGEPALDGAFSIMGAARGASDYGFNEESYVHLQKIFQGLVDIEVKVQ